MTTEEKQEKANGSGVYERNIDRPRKGAKGEGSKETLGKRNKRIIWTMLPLKAEERIEGEGSGTRGKGLEKT